MTTASPPIERPKPYGIGGWLILPVIGFVGTILMTAWNMLQGAAEFAGLKAIFMATEGPLVQLRMPVLVSLAGGCLVMASAAYCLFLIFRKDAAIVKFATLHYVILLLAGFGDLWGDGVIQQAVPGTPADPAAIRDAARGVIAAIIWIPYFHISKRVKNTFTNGAAPAH